MNWKKMKENTALILGSSFAALVFYYGIKHMFFENECICDRQHNNKDVVPKPVLKDTTIKSNAITYP